MVDLSDIMGSIPQQGNSAPNSAENQSIIDMLKQGPSGGSQAVTGKLPPGLGVQDRIQDAGTPAESYARLRGAGMSHDQAVETMRAGGMRQQEANTQYLDPKAPLY